MAAKNEMKTGFYRLRTKREDGTHKPVVSVCLLWNTNTGRTSKGYAICSDQDQFCNKKGKKIAEARAWKAYTEGITSSPVAYHKAKSRLNILPKVIRDIQYKAHFEPELTPHDEKLMKELAA